MMFEFVMTKWHDQQIKTKRHAYHFCTEYKKDEVLDDPRSSLRDNSSENNDALSP